jgi:hypothetical protein
MTYTVVRCLLAYMHDKKIAWCSDLALGQPLWHTLILVTWLIWKHHNAGVFDGSPLQAPLLQGGWSSSTSSEVRRSSLCLRVDAVVWSGGRYYVACSCGRRGLIWGCGREIWLLSGRVWWRQIGSSGPGCVYDGARASLSGASQRLLLRMVGGRCGGVAHLSPDPGRVLWWGFLGQKPWLQRRSC